MRTLTLAGLLAIALVATLPSCQKELANKQSAVSASTTSNVVEHKTTFSDYDSDDDTGGWWDPCTNEYIHVTGKVVGVSTYVTVNGMVNVSGVGYYKLTGTGVFSGTVYQGKILFTGFDQLIWDAEGGYYQEKIGDFSTRVTLTTPGGKNNLTYIYYWKGVVNANGDLVVSINKFVYDTCK